MMKKVDKPWGYELIWAHTPNYVGKVLFVKQGHQLSRQYHEKKEETLLLRKGTGEIEIGDRKLILSTHPTLTRDGKLTASETVVHIPPGTIHRIRALSDIELIEVSTPELDDVVRLEDDYNRVENATQSEKFLTFGPAERETDARTPGPYRSIP
jgi:mannose-6-phosphate isomerase